MHHGSMVLQPLAALDQGNAAEATRRFRSRCGGAALTWERNGLDGLFTYGRVTGCLAVQCICNRLVQRASRRRLQDGGDDLGVGCGIE